MGVARVGVVALRQRKGCSPVKLRDSHLTRERGTDGRVAAAVPLPCLNSNNSIGSPLTEAQKSQVNTLSTSHRKTAFALAENVGRLCRVYGIDRIGFLTLTFADHVTCAKEASRRYNSLRTNVLVGRYVETICVMERMKSGRIHYHLLVVLSDDVRTGFDFEAATKGVYSSANAQLRAEWSFWRANARKYGFGRTELLPVKSTAEGISKYVGKYIAKHIDAREFRDKGVRLVRYSKGANACGTKFQFRSPRSRLWRWQVGEFAKRNGCADLAALKDKFGIRWAYHQRGRIMDLEPPSLVVAVQKVEGEEDVWVTLWDIWTADRFANSQRVAQATGCTQAEAFIDLYQSDLAARFARSACPALPVRSERYEQIVRAENARHAQHLANLDSDGERVDRVTIWADGRVDRLPSKQIG